MIEVTPGMRSPGTSSEEGCSHSLQVNPQPEDVAAYHIHGPFLFGAADKLGVIEDNLDALPAVGILRLRNMTAIDAIGLNACFVKKVQE